VLAARKEREQAAAESKPRKGAGKLERAAFVEIDEMGLSGSEYTRFRETALMAARAADTAMAEGKLHLLNQTVKTLNEAMDKLHGMATAPKPDGGGDKGASNGDFVDAYLDT
jgi:hypothetical protein